MAASRSSSTRPPHVANSPFGPDRLLTPQVYTQAGLDWIDQNSFKSLLLRHYPQLAPALEGVENGFAPWKRVSAST